MKSKAKEIIQNDSIFLIKVLFAVSLLFIGCDVNQSVQADLIVHNANILTVDDKFSTQKTMVIKDGRIVHLLNNNNYQKHIGPETEIINLRGKTVLPGFIEPHTHPVASTTLYEWNDVSGMTHTSAKKALRSLKKAIKEIPEGEWILAFGWDMMLLDDAFPLTKDYLDKNISDKHPIWIMMQSMHTHYFNSMALRKAGITRKTPEPVSGGHYQKDKNGNLTGIVTESAVNPMIATLPPLKYKEAKRLIKKMYRRYNSAGITTIGVTGMVGILPGHDPLKITKELAQEVPSNLRVFHYGMGMPGIQDSCISSDNLTFRDIGKKYWVDGSPYTGSMLIEEPYLSSTLNQQKLGIKKNSLGECMFPSGMYYKLFKEAIDHKWQLSVHVQGDSAATVALKSLEPVLRDRAGEDKRHRFEHLALVKKEQLHKMKNLGITPSFHVNHIYYYGDSLSSGIIGPKRAERLMPVGSAINIGHRPTLHNDSPMYPPRPLLAVRTAVTRMTSSGQVLGESEKISVKEAIKAITINAAWQLHAENEIGSLEKGKIADFVILESDPTKVPSSQINNIRVIATYLAGKKIL